MALLRGAWLRRKSLIAPGVLGQAIGETGDFLISSFSKNRNEKQHFRGHVALHMPSI